MAKFIKNKVYSIINILGLPGMAVAMLIALWIWMRLHMINIIPTMNSLRR